MSDIPFDIDDILNEINKRKEEIEQEIDSVSVNTEAVQSRVAEKEAETKSVEAEPEPTEPEPESPQAEEDPAAEQTELPAPEGEENLFNDHELNASYFEEVDRIFAEADGASENAGEKADEGDGVNIFDFAENVPAESENADMVSTRKSRSNKKQTKKRKILTSVIIVLVIAIVGTGAFGLFYVNDILNSMTEDDPDNAVESKIEKWAGMDELVVKFDDIYEESDVSSYRDMIKKWYYNGEPASSTNILNVLLIGEDTRGEEIKDSGSLADSVIIASVNIETGELILSSILRDTYAYYEVVPGDESTGTYGKINSAMSKGGLSAYINAVERLFKINIDNYVLVNFANFKKIIDYLGGVTVEMTAAEIREINNNPGTYGNVYIEGDAGEKLLTGEQALAYCRIRHLDSDNVRADRQKTVLLNVFSQLKSASMFKMTSVVTKLLPYVKTGFSKSEILSIGEYALTKGWLSYKVVTHTVPNNETRADGTPITVCVGGQGSNFYNTWCWKVDFPLATQVLQEKIYGRTNVILADRRPSFSKLSAY